MIVFNRLFRTSQQNAVKRRDDIPCLRLAVIGAGRIADKHLSVFSTFGEVEIAAICNRGNSDLSPLAQAFSIRSTFSDWRKMLDVVKPDAALILVSHFQTVEVTGECLQRNIPCLIEKPAGFTSGETAYLADLADKHRCLNMVAVNRRYYSSINAAVKAVQICGPIMGVFIEAPENIDHIRATSRHSQELIDRWLVANTIHAIDLFRHIGGEIAEVQAMTHAWHEPQADSFSATLRFASGAIGTFLAHWQAPGSGWRLNIYGDGVQASLSPFERGELRYADGGIRAIPVDPVDSTFKPGFYAQARAFVDALLYSEPLSPPASDLRDAQKTMQLIEQIGGAS